MSPDETAPLPTDDAGTSDPPDWLISGTVPLRPGVAGEIRLRHTPPSPTTRPPDRAWDEAAAITAILDSPALTRDRLHGRMVEMLRQLGEWQGYGVLTERKLTRSSPYALDCLWLAGEHRVAAFEVQIDGSLDHALAALDYARHVGWQRVILVTVDAHRARLRKLLHHHTLRVQLLVWSLTDLWQLHVHGSAFFTLRHRLERRPRLPGHR